MKVHLERRARWRTLKAFIIATLMTGLTPAIAAPATHLRHDLDLPLAGLRVLVNLPLTTTVAQHSRWQADRYEDVLVITSEGQAITYAIEVAGRTAKDCPLDEPFPIELGGDTWIESRTHTATTTLCRMLLDARALVRISSPDALDLMNDPRAIERHAQILRPLLDSLRVRRLIPSPSPALPSPDSPPPPTLTLPNVGLALATPNDRMLWRVASPEGADFDSLIRVLPVFPEVQIAVRRHALSDVPGCARLMRYLLNSHWSASPISPPADWDGLVGKRHGRFTSLGMCREEAGALVDVRAASRPAIALDELASILAALAAAEATDVAPPSPLPHAPTRAALTRTAMLAVGCDFPGTERRRGSTHRAPPGPFSTLDLSANYTHRNGLALAANLNIGADRAGVIIGAGLETGVALALDDELTLVIALGFEDRRETLFSNRSMTLVVDMRANHHVPGAFAWSLRLTPLLLASREPAISGVPLAFSWTGLFPSGVAIGVDLRWISSPLRPSDAWKSEGLAVGVRFGFGDITR